MKVKNAYLAFLIVYPQFVFSVRSTKPGPNALWPVLYFNDAIREPPSSFTSALESLSSVARVLDENSILPGAQSTSTFNGRSNEYKDAVFYSELARAVACRPLSDYWDCDLCMKLLPDAVVVRSFSTFPLDVTGILLMSLK
ncbi:hypothetical protein A0J61_03682 [Choanephora cucurbitarum]|uniref:Uncharacterized protein n=1 Tax=Choanephora cucurbitarum TaxID=101091 RepID=A0A1C7NIB2_9FUNG|nr:hypothetical protein A0J61_03682 [Choanephora cucurbitarum]